MATPEGHGACLEPHSYSRTAPHVHPFLLLWPREPCRSCQIDTGLSGHSDWSGGGHALSLGVRGSFQGRMKEGGQATAEENCAPCHSRAHPGGEEGWCAGRSPPFRWTTWPWGLSATMPPWGASATDIKGHCNSSAMAVRAITGFSVGESNMFQFKFWEKNCSQTVCQVHEGARLTEMGGEGGRGP